MCKVCSSVTALSPRPFLGFYKCPDVKTQDINGRRGWVRTRGNSVPHLCCSSVHLKLFQTKKLNNNNKNKLKKKKKNQLILPACLKNVLSFKEYEVRVEGPALPLVLSPRLSRVVMANRGAPPIDLLLRACKVKSLSRVPPFVIPCTVQSVEFFRPEYWSG